MKIRKDNHRKKTHLQNKKVSVLDANIKNNLNSSTFSPQIIVSCVSSVKEYLGSILAW